MGVDNAIFDQNFDEALPVAARRVTVDEIAMSDAHRADTCQSIIGSLQ